MAPVTLSEETNLGRLLECLQPDAVVEGPLDAGVRTVTCDSRQVRAGDVFVAIHGLRAEGSEYAAEAVKRGAVAVVTEDESLRGQLGAAALVLVPDARVALARLACELQGHPTRSLRVIGITGTNGKTTTTFLVRHLLESSGEATGLLGSIAYELKGRRIPAQRTTPEASELQALFAKMVRAGCLNAVMEVSSHGLSQERVLGTEFDVVGFTNLTPEHLDYHGTLEAYFEAKARLFEAAVRLGATGVVNRDDPWGRTLVDRFGGEMRLLTFGLEPGADVRAVDVELREDCVRFRLESPWHRGPVQAPLLGRFNVYNSLTALAVAGALGLPVDRAAADLAKAPPVPGRMQRVEGPPGVHVYVDYAHTEDALRNALDALREVAGRRLLVVFGCGGDRDVFKRPRMGAVAVERCDVVVLTTDNPRSEPPQRILAEIRAGCSGSDKLVEILDRREAIRYALRAAQPGDLLLIAGKGHEAYQEVGNTVLAFDDCRVVREESRDMSAP